MYISDAEGIARASRFELIVNDSIFVIGSPGGVILDQNPKPVSEVKSGRKIYVNITKYQPDYLRVSELPVLYGNDFNQKKIELSYRDIGANVKDYRYDPGEPDHILEVYYKERLIINRNTFLADVKIAKGDKLDFILSQSSGGDVAVPNLVCLSFSEAIFILESNKLSVGNILESGEITNRAVAVVIGQSPLPGPEELITRGSTVGLTISQNKPDDCL
jgi:eukaryotic-like serine/threonine-protein kinase